MRLLLKLTPVRTGRYIDQISIETKPAYPCSDDYYTMAYAHIDTFWEGKNGNSDIHEKLSNGEVVYIDAHLTEVVGEE